MNTDIQLNEDGTFKNMAILWRHLLAGGVATCGGVKLSLDQEGNIPPSEVPTQSRLWRPYARPTVSFGEAMNIVTDPENPKRVRMVGHYDDSWLTVKDNCIVWCSGGSSFTLFADRVRARYEVEGLE